MLLGRGVSDHGQKSSGRDPRTSASGNWGDGRHQEPSESRKVGIEEEPLSSPADSQSSQSFNEATVILRMDRRLRWGIAFRPLPSALVEIQALGLPRNIDSKSHISVCL